MENNLLLNIIEDKYRKFQKDYAIVTTDFLDMAEQSAAAGFVRAHTSEGAFFWGGFENAERRKVVFVPDYFNVKNEDELMTFFREEPEHCPLKILDVRIAAKGAKLRHSDYMGSLLALGVKREKTGDILASDDGAQIIVNAEIAEYLAENYTRAGKTPLSVKIADISELKFADANIEHVRISLSSPRLDNAVSGAFGISRKAAVEAINRGLVFVNSVENKKPDFVLKGNEKLVLRGKGKAIYRGISGTSRRGKLYAEFDKYI